MRESELTDQLIAAMSQHFDIRREVSGKNLLTGGSIRADIVAYPKPQLIETGFAAGFFCVEVKAVPSIEPDKRGRDAAWQALSYRLSRFDFGVPVFAFVYPALCEFYIGDGSSIDYFNPTRADLNAAEKMGHYREIGAIMQRGNVGWIEISKPDKYRPDGDLALMFAAGRYWSKTRGISLVKNLGTKIHAGSRN